MIKQASDTGRNEMTKNISVSQFPLTEDNIEVSLWVTSPQNDALGIITKVRVGESDSYIDIEWLDGGPTQHPMSEIIEDAIIKGAVAASLLPEWSR